MHEGRLMCDEMKGPWGSYWQPQLIYYRGGYNRKHFGIAATGGEGGRRRRRREAKRLRRGGIGMAYQGRLAHEGRPMRDEIT